MREVPEAAPEPTLGFGLERIERSRNVDELAEVAPYAAMLRKDGDKETARRAYGDKLSGLRASAAPESGEEPVQEANSLRTYAEVRDHIERAPSIEALDEAVNMIDAVSHPDYREELREIAQARREGFTQ